MESPILVRLFKEESELEVWKQDREGRFALLKTYPICRWSGELGPKIKEGDRQAPEGFYSISPGQMNPNSQYYLSFDLGYPNAYDRAYGRTGAQLMVHGDCSSRGCYSMTDEQISEIYALGRDSFFGGQKSFQVQAYPFRMTAQNLAKHRNSPHLAFWKMLKKGNDHFEVSKLEPKVNVCDKRYVFDAQSPGRALSFNATAKCPAYEVPEEIASLVRDKERTDDLQFADLSRRNVPLAPIKTNADGGDASGVCGSGEEEPDRRRAAGSQPVCHHPAGHDPGHGAAAAHSRTRRRTGCRGRSVHTGHLRRGHASRDGHCRDQAHDPIRPHGRAAAACSAACSRRRRRKPSPPNQRAKAPSIAWRAWSVWARRKPRRQPPRPRRSRNLSPPPSQRASPRMVRSAPSRPKHSRSRPPKHKLRRRVP
jgi:Uncharacterized protein conserved in bacteria